LKENAAMSGYLNKHSMAFYELFKERNGTMIISINTQNQNCASIYLKKGEGRASASEYDFSSQTGTLIVDQAETGHYDITIEGSDNCFYSIDYSTTVDKKYSVLERGLYNDIKLDKDEETRMLYKHSVNESFRVLTLHQSGEVIIKVKSYKDVREFVEDNSTKPKYIWSGQDFLRIDAGTLNFCFECYYLIVFSAERNTKTSVIIPTPSTEFPIMVDSIIKEELKKGEYERLRVYNDKLMQF
jgi:hypothetical protein